MILDLLNEIQRGKFEEKATYDITGMNSSRSSLYIRLLCTIAHNKLDQTKYLIESEFHLIE